MPYLPTGISFAFRKTIRKVMHIVMWVENLSLFPPDIGAQKLNKNHAFGLHIYCLCGHASQRQKKKAAEVFSQLSMCVYVE